MNKSMQNEIDKLINSDLSKREVFENLKTKYKNKQELANKIQETIYPTSKINYKGLNNTLLIILILSAVLDLISLSYFAIIADSIFIYLVYNYKAKYYSWIAVRAALSIILGVFIIAHNTEDTLVLILTIIVFLMIVASFIIGIYLENKLSPSLKSKRVNFIDENGITKYRNEYNFN